MSKSSILAVSYPTGIIEGVQTHRNLQNWLGKDTERANEPEPTWEEITTEYQDKPIDVEREVRELVGKCLWDIFSDEHDVVALDDRIVHLGSWRGAAGFIADQLNRQRRSGQCCYDYLDFTWGRSQSRIEQT